MIIRLRCTLIALALALLPGLTALPASPAFAGQVSDPSDCGCGADGAGGGYCWGTLECFRQLPDPNATADMWVNYTTWYLQVTFAAKFKGTTYFCAVTDPNRQPLAMAAIAGLGPRNPFWVWWDSSGTCNQIYIGHTSADLP